MLKITPAERLKGQIRVPGDKSISHRAVMIGSLARGVTEIDGFLPGKDCLSTIRCFRLMGVLIEREGERVKVHGRGLEGLSEPDEILDVGNSGTTIRLLAGILAGQPFTAILTGDETIRRRPMSRVTNPLREMGALVLGRDEGNLAPLVFRGTRLTPLVYRSPLASAQVKSAVLLAGLYADGWTEVIEPAATRNHTELMLQAFGAEIKTADRTVGIRGFPELKAQKVTVPGDISSAAFLMVAGLIVPGSEIVIENVGLNPTRAGILEVLQAMGGKISVFSGKTVAGEKIGTVKVETSDLTGVSVGGDLIPRLIDELPILAVAGLFARGITEIRDAAELKVKESNRIQAMIEGIVRLGGRAEELPDGMRIYGGYPLKGNKCRGYHDHRIAMALAVAGLHAEGETQIEEAEAIDVSFPGFVRLLNCLKGSELLED